MAVKRFFDGESRRLLRYVWPYRFRVLAGVAALAFVGLSEGLVALMFQPMIDTVLTPAGSGAKLTLLKNIPILHRPLVLNSFFPHWVHHVFTIFAVSLLVLFFSRALADYFGVVTLGYVGLAGVTDLRNDIYAKLIRQPVGFFQQHPAGRLLSAIINDIERVRTTLSDTVAGFFQYLFTLFFLVAVLLLLSWKMTIGVMIFVPLVVWPVAAFGRRIRRAVTRVQNGFGELTQIVQETISGNRVVKAFGMEGFEIAKFRDAARRLFRENMDWIRNVARTSPAMDILAAVAVCLAVAFARTQIKMGVLTTGAFGAFTYAMFRAYEPIKGLGNVYQHLQEAHGATGQVFAFLDLQEEQPDAAGAKVLPPFSSDVEFEDVSFTYEGTRTPILCGINLKANRGEVLAIVGSSGAGKTTLVNLLPRFYTATSGAIRLDGIDVREVTLRSLRSQMAIVTQETVLFNDTVWNNICYGQPGLPEERVFNAAKVALAHDFILALPKGYQTVIGDLGRSLSGGQRQRLAIARAVLKDSPILILDEATSELDSESEQLVQRALANLMTGRTSFVIAHRLSTIRRADKIVVIEDGVIRETGTHQELLAGGGTYARLYEMQFADDDDPSPAPVPPGALPS
ncbi:MAG: ABC transporter ATP-binding protein [Candidatus Acidiferrales bacterium]